MARSYKKNDALVGGVLVAGAFILIRNAAIRGARRTVVQNAVRDDDEVYNEPHYEKTASEGVYLWGATAEEVRAATETGTSYVLLTQDKCWAPVEDNLCYSFWIASQIHEKDAANGGGEEYSIFISTSPESSGFDEPTQLPALMILNDGQVSEEILGEESILQYLAARFPMTY